MDLKKTTNLSIEDVKTKPTEEIMNSSFDCVCGKTHTIPIKKLSIGEDIIGSIVQDIKNLGISGTGGVIFDKRIENRVARNVIESLKKSGIETIEKPMGDGVSLIKPEIRNSENVAKILKDRVNFLISIGSGVISDITKYAATILSIPSILIATAPSMNGYTSTLAAMTDRGIKKTMPISNLIAIYADINILKDAPTEMVLSGFGDILSKASCIADWKLSNLIKKSYFCPMSFYITDITEKRYMAIPEEIGKKSRKGIKELTDGIMRSGLSMTIIGTSTPSSGSEHVISHYWDLLALIYGRKKLLHGTQVGVATPIAVRLFDFLSEYPIKKRINLEYLKSNYPDENDIISFLNNKYKGYSDGLWEQLKKKYMIWSEKKNELEYILDNWYDIWDNCYKFIRPAKEIEKALEKSGAPKNYSDIDLSIDDAMDAIINGWVLRSRYTILDTLHDLGLSKEAAEKVL